MNNFTVFQLLKHHSNRMPKSSVLKSDSPRQSIASKAFVPSLPPPILSLTKAQIVEVWAENLETEFAKITELIEEGFTVVAVVTLCSYPKDTEFPGIVKNPNVDYRNSKVPSSSYSGI